MVSSEDMSKRVGGDNESGTRLATPEELRDVRELGRLESRETGKSVARLAESEKDLSHKRMDTVYDRFDVAYESINNLRVKKFNYSSTEHADRVKENKARMKRKFEVALVTGDAHKLANNGDYAVPATTERMIDQSLTELNEDELIVLGGRVLEKIRTPVQKKGAEAVLEEISLTGDDEVLIRLYNMTLDWKEKYSEDREYSKEEQKQAGIESIRELVEVNPTAADFIKYKNDYLKKLEQDATRDTGSDDEAYEAKIAELETWRSSAEQLGRLVYGRQYDYTEVYEEMIEDAKKKKAKEIPGVPRFKTRAEMEMARSSARKIEPNPLIAETDEDEDGDEDTESEEPIRFRIRGAEVNATDATEENVRFKVRRTGEKNSAHEETLYEGLSRLDLDSEASRLHVQRTLEGVTTAPGKANKKFGDILRKLGLQPDYSFDETGRSGLEPSYFYAAGKELDTFYDFSRSFFVQDGDERRRALILYEPYSQTEGVDFNKVYYDPIVLIETDDGVEAVTSATSEEDRGTRLKTAELRTDLKLGDIAKSIFDTEDKSIDLRREKKVNPGSLVSAIYRDPKHKPGLKNEYKVIQ